MRLTRIFTLLALCLSLLPLRAMAGEVTIFAAASLKTALDDIAPQFEAETGHRMVAVYAGTPVLARQIVQGAPADLFLSANPDWMDYIEAQGIATGDTRRDLLGNRLVLIAPRDGTAAGATGPLAMALVDAVPAGIYGKAALEHENLWDRHQDRIVQTDNVRAALALVALGEAPLGLVYATDARADPRVMITHEFATTSHPPIRYPLAALNNRAPTRALLDFLTGPEAARTFEDMGFETIGGGA